MATQHTTDMREMLAPEPAVIAGGEDEQEDINLWFPPVPEDDPDDYNEYEQEECSSHAGNMEACNDGSSSNANTDDNPPTLGNPVIDLTNAIASGGEVTTSVVDDGGSSVNSMQQPAGKHRRATIGAPRVNLHLTVDAQRLSLPDNRFPSPEALIMDDQYTLVRRKGKNLHDLYFVSHSHLLA
jgi:hypothetical protein